ncbi:CPBP family intramembrane glutamic endopeptidase [Paenibacillus segetis]|uniref:CAAX prenyl protease 2/Lysostaphin resistance protein A-like domain-containing protein n=1 Tax=Paenibacillus segetis TaxID=1325360 RepID=A0ABQ1YUY8_9BACL|nr:type II CAAX endopeptidase family protein [Paenibacillus segetis]GGH37030.1 hypothetical protein GCM10008013_44260 [Paenibacillus segetis]
MLQTQSNKSSFFVKRPILFVIVVEVLLLIIVTVGGAIATIKELDYIAAIWVSFTPIALILVIYLTWKRKWGSLGFQSLSTITKQNWLYHLPLILVLITISLKGFEDLSVSKVIQFVSFTLLVGFVEETVYRGLILKAMLNVGVKAAVITSSLLFAVTHALNMISGQDLANTVVQIVYSLLIGVVLALLMVRGSNIYPLILFHFLHNLIQFLGPEATGVTYFDVIALVILVIYSIVLIKSLNKKTIKGSIAA